MFVVSSLSLLDFFLSYSSFVLSRQTISFMNCKQFMPVHERLNKFFSEWKKHWLKLLEFDSTWGRDRLTAVLGFSILSHSLVAFSFYLLLKNSLLTGIWCSKDAKGVACQLLRCDRSWEFSRFPFGWKPLQITMIPELHYPMPSNVPVSSTHSHSVLSNRLNVSHTCCIGYLLPQCARWSSIHGRTKDCSRA